MSDHDTIRRRTTDDLEQAGRALVEVHARDGYPVEGVADPIAWLADPAPLHAWVAERDGRIVGHVAAIAPKGSAAVAHWHERHPGRAVKVAELGRLFVAPTARGAGLGERLIGAVVDWADTYGLTLVLDVMAKDSAAIRLYERLGWTRMDETAHVYGDGQQEPAYTYEHRSPD